MCLSLTRVESESNITIGTFSEEKGDIDVHSFPKDSEIAKFETTFSEVSILSLTAQKYKIGGATSVVSMKIISFGHFKK